MFAGPQMSWLLGVERGQITAQSINAHYKKLSIVFREDPASPLGCLKKSSQVFKCSAGETLTNTKLKLQAACYKIPHCTHVHSLIFHREYQWTWLTNE